MADIRPITTFPWTYNFNAAGVLEESSLSSPWWLLNSGGRMVFENGVGRTLFGQLPIGDKWQVAHKAKNPQDTDGGTRPQNIFRLYTRQAFTDMEQTAYYRIRKYNLSTPGGERGPSNGLLHFHRMSADGKTGYYAGIRVDGKPIIKRKQNDTYTPGGGMAGQNIYPLLFPGEYNETTNPILIPQNVWIGLRTRCVKEGTGLRFTVWTDVGRTGTWKQVLTYLDTGTYWSIIASGHSGIRTDFMDCEFEDLTLAVPGAAVPLTPREVAYKWADANVGKSFWHAASKSAVTVVAKGTYIDDAGDVRLRVHVVNGAPDTVAFVNLTLSKCLSPIEDQTFNALDKYQL